MHKSTYLLGKLSLWGDISRSTMSSKDKRDKMWSIYSVAARLNSIDTNFINKYSQKEELPNIAAEFLSQQSQVLRSTKVKNQFLEQFHRFLIVQRCLFRWH